METLRVLEEIIEGMETAVSENRRDDLIESDFQFHYAIIRSSSNALFRSLYETLRSFLHGEIKRSQDDYEDPAQICTEHRSLLRAFETGNTLVAAEAFDEHIENIKQRLRGAAESAGAVSGRAHGTQKADALDGTHEADALDDTRGGESRTPGSGAE